MAASRPPTSSSPPSDPAGFVSRSCRARAAAVASASSGTIPVLASANGRPTSRPSDAARSIAPAMPPRRLRTPSRRPRPASRSTGRSPTKSVPAPPPRRRHASSTRGSGLAAPMSLDVTTTSSSVSRPVGASSPRTVASSMTAVSVTAPLRSPPASARTTSTASGKGVAASRVDHRRCRCRFLDERAADVEEDRVDPRDGGHRYPFSASVSRSSPAVSGTATRTPSGIPKPVSRTSTARRARWSRKPGAAGRARSWHPTARDRGRAAERSRGVPLRCGRSRPPGEVGARGARGPPRTPAAHRPLRLARGERRRHGVRAAQ